MSKELYVTSTPHETKLAVVEDDQLVEVFFERENEYTLAGSIYKGKVTRVLPGMQSAFVEIGLERDAFLYVTDFLEEVEEDDSEPIKQSSPENGQEHERADRPERSGRPERGRGGRGRHRRGDRDTQSPQRTHASAPAEGSFTIEHDSTEVLDESAELPTEASSAHVAETGNEGDVQGQQDSRGPRRWRGRRGRRRRGGVPESKFAQPENAGETDSNAHAVPELADEGDPPLEEQEMVAEAGAMENTSAKPQPVAEDAMPSAHADQPRRERPRREGRFRDIAVNQDQISEQPSQDETPVGEERPREAKEERPRQEIAREERPREERPRSQPIILPGESLAKFGRKAEDTEEATAPPQRSANVPRPSTEYTAPAGFAAAGLLAGESLAKYRSRPPQEERKAGPRHESATPEARSERNEKVMTERPAPPARESSMGAAPDTSPETASEAVAETHAANHSSVRHEPNDSRAEYGFQPGQGVVEEEEIEEEEHEFAPFSENLDESEFEELEEETLEHREDEVIAATAGIAEAFARSRSEDETDIYMSEGADASDEEDDDEAGDDVEGESEEGTAVEAELYADAADDAEEADDNHGNQLDPDDPNYSARAETRAGAGTAGMQQRSERRPMDRSRRDRGRKGRPPMRRGGPRRNIVRGPMPQIGELLKEGQEILVQIAKEPMAKKGARITSHIALPGRFLVFMPTVNHTGVSRKIGSDEERQRLKRILLSEKGQSNGGFIVRTAAAGASEEDLRADIRFLINLWNEIKQRAETSKAPALIYHDLNLVERILRDQVTANFSHIWVDTENEYERILRFASRFQPSLVKRVKLYTKDTPLFEQFNIQEEINKGLKSKVWLKSGGYIVINQTEALVAIDINTGKYVGKTGRLEDTIVKTNLDAIKEIVRQIRLRDLGGIIIIDFIDMDERKNRQKVMQALEAELKNDRSPSKVLQFNDFGLVAITRKRVKQSLERTLSTPCVYCTGTGMIKSVATVCNEIYVEMRKMNRHLEGGQVMLRVNPEVAKALKENQGRWLTEMEELTKKSIIVKSDPAQHQEQFDIH